MHNSTHHPHVGPRTSAAAAAPRYLSRAWTPPSPSVRFHPAPSRTATALSAGTGWTSPRVTTCLPQSRPSPTLELSEGGCGVTTGAKARTATSSMLTLVRRRRCTSCHKNFEL